jgi:cell division protein FtsB
MKIFALVLVLLLALLQARLWVSGEGVRKVNRLEQAVAEQQKENATLKARNERLAAEVKDLKEGMTAVEERARSDLGMVGANETFYQVVPPEKPPPRDRPAVPAEPAQPPASQPQSSQQALAR